MQLIPSAISRGHIFQVHSQNFLKGGQINNYSLNLTFLLRVFHVHSKIFLELKGGGAPPGLF